MSHYLKHIPFYCLLSGLLSGCMIGPDYQKPTISAPTHYKEARQNKARWTHARPNDLTDRGDWWAFFNSPELNRLEQELNNNDQNILVAKAQYEQALALVDEARAAYFPTVAATAALNYQNSWGSTQLNNSGFSSGESSSRSLGLSATWEPDLWGSVGRNVEATQATADASKAQLASIRLSEQASLAQFYFELRGVDSDQLLLNKTVVSNRNILISTNNGLQQGTASMADVLTSKSQLENSQALAINNHINRALYEHAIAVLIGKSPAELSIPFHPVTGKPPVIANQLPSQLLERRPDIAAAERNVAAANAQIGVAMTAYFPLLTLNPAGGIQGNGLENWVSLPLFSWSLGVTLAETIFDGGLRSATVAAARANYRATVAQYRETVLTAFQNVEDNLAALRILQQQAGVSDLASQDAQAGLQLTRNQFNAGTASYPNVYVSQVNAYTAEKNAVDVKTLQMTYTVALIKALGGGWDRQVLFPQSISLPKPGR